MTTLIVPVADEEDAKKLDKDDDDDDAEPTELKL